MNRGWYKTQAMPKVSDSIVLTTAIISARFFGGKQAAVMLYMADKQRVIMLEKSAFKQRLHRPTHTLSELFYYGAGLFKALIINGQYLIDSFPATVCDKICISRSRFVKSEEYRAKIASKRRLFFGFRPGRRAVQLVTTVDKKPMQFFMMPGSVANVRALQMMYGCGYPAELACQ